MIPLCVMGNALTQSSERQMNLLATPAMVYISSWQEYQEAAEALYEKSPNTVRAPHLAYC